MKKLILTILLISSFSVFSQKIVKSSDKSTRVTVSVSNYTPANNTPSGHFAGINTALSTKSNLASPIFTGTPEAPTPTTPNGITNKGYVDNATITSGTITTATNITNATPTDTYLPQNGKTLLISNGATNINYTINGAITASFVKGGTGTITFVQGSGRTMVAANGTLVFNGAQYSTASVVSFGTTDIVYINNF